MSVPVVKIISSDNGSNYSGADIESLTPLIEKDFELVPNQDESSDRNIKIGYEYTGDRTIKLTTEPQVYSWLLKIAIALPSFKDIPWLNIIKFPFKKAIIPVLVALPIAGGISLKPVQAQSITPASDGTNTIVNQAGNRLDINGGTLSGDGTNLFHSFTKFGLNAGEIANFISNPDIRNILGRVTGGDASLINGLIQVTGGNSNLFLMNPAGIIFGTGASLNVPASFTATTATGIGFGSNWFNASGINNYAILNGTPSIFAFEQSGAGAIINAGQLAVTQGQNLTLLGGSVVSTGNLSAQSGTITVASVPGENLVRISQIGHLLSLEIQPTTSNGSSTAGLPLPLSLPQLLTKSGVSHATGLTTNSNGQVVLTGSNIPVSSNPGTTIIAGNVDVSNTQAGGTAGAAYALGKQVGLIDHAIVNASGAAGGGTILIGGDYLGSGTVPNAAFTFVGKDVNINADGIINGNGGKVILWSEQATRAYGTITARGGATSGNGGFIETSSKNYLDVTSAADASATNGIPGTWLLDPSNITIINGDAEVSGNLDDFSPNFIAENANPDASDSTVSNAIINLALSEGTNVTISTKNAADNQAGNIVQNADAPIVPTPSATPSSTIPTLTLEAANSIELNGSINITEGGGAPLNVVLQGEDAGRANTIKINSSIDTKGGSFNSKSIDFDSSGNTISTNGGNISIDASNNVKTGFINTNSANFSDSGNIELTALAGTITLGDDLNTSTFSGAGGNITLNGNVEIASSFISLRTGGNFTDGNIIITGTLDGSGDASQTLILDAGTNGNVIFGNTVGNNIPLDKLNVIDAANVTLNGNVTANSNISFSAPVTVNGDVALTANEIDFLAGNGTVTGTGNLTLQPATPSRNIVIGGTYISGGEIPIFNPVANALNLTINDINALQSGFSSITIGRADSSGAITLAGNVTLNAPVTLRSPTGSGSINTTGFSITGASNAPLTLLANQAITTGNITNPGGNITITSNSGNIDTSAGTLTTSGGAITFNAVGDIITGVLNSSAVTNGGLITLNTNGNITTGNLIFGATGSTGIDNLLRINTPGIVNLNGAIATNGADILIGDITAPSQINLNFPNTLFTIGGDILLNSSGNLTIAKTLDTDGGKITLLGAAIDTNSGLLDSSNTNGNGGNVSLEATTGTLNAGTIDARSFLSNGLGGTISLKTTSAAINFTPASTFTNGDISLTTDSGTIKTIGGDINARGISIISNSSLINIASNLNTTTGGITIKSNSGEIDTAAISLNSIGGTINLETGNQIKTGSITSNGGAISLKGKSINASGTINSSSDVSNGGAIALTASNQIITGEIDSSSSLGNGGAIALIATDQITTGEINSSSSLGNGGNVFIDPTGDVQVTSINAQGGSTGIGGNVDITTGSLFRALGTFTDQNEQQASISTAGGLGGGTITIRHGGGSNNIPFVVGNALTNNGTAGVITRGNATAENTVTSPQSFPGTHKQDNDQIQIITQNPPTIDPPPQPETIPLPDPERFQKQPISQLPTSTTLPSVEIDPFVGDLEAQFTSQFEQYLGVDAGIRANIPDERDILATIEETTGVKPAFVYVAFVPQALASGSTTNSTKALKQTNQQDISQFNPQGSSNSQLLARQQPRSENLKPQDNDQLELVIVTAKGAPIRKQVEGATRKQVLEFARQFRQDVTSTTSSRRYQKPAKQLYDWLIAPLEADLQARGINNLVFLMDAGLRSLPIAALYDGKQFLVEKYSVGLMPSLSLTDTRYRDIKKSEVLAMGASKFTTQKPLPAVPTELSTIAQQLWRGKSFLNEAFTINNLKLQRREAPFGIIHLATHGEFKSGKPNNSYIQFWDKQLQLDQIRQLGFNEPPVELLVLSACRTALGDEQAELGFAGFAVMAGVKSALASLWYVSDEGTLALMADFYEQLKVAPIKAEALRLAQVAMIKGEVRLQDGKLRTSKGDVSLPPEVAKLGNKDLKHPYYWAGFTLIGNPW